MVNLKKHLSCLSVVFFKKIQSSVFHLPTKGMASSCAEASPLHLLFLQRSIEWACDIHVTESPYSV